MSYTPPTTFSAGTKLAAAEVQGNVDSLRVYLHDGIVAGDLRAAKWIETRHVQPPIFEPYSGVQHGVTGHQGGQWGGGNLARLTFATNYLAGNAKNGVVPSDWNEVPSSSFRVEIRQAATVLFHWWVEVQTGPDGASTSGISSLSRNDRLVRFSPYLGNTAFKFPSEAQCVPNPTELMESGYPYGGARSYAVMAGYGQRDGVHLFSASPGTFTVGLCVFSEIDVAKVINWGIAIETFYL